MISGRPRSWQMWAMPAMFAQVPYGVGLTTRAAAASGWRSQASAICSGEGGWAMCRSASQRGVTQHGRSPEKISPATTDLWASRLSNRSPS